MSSNGYDGSFGFGVRQPGDLLHTCILVVLCGVREAIEGNAEIKATCQPGYVCAGE